MATRTEALSPERELEENITRFDIHQIIQHAVLMVTFILLVFTGIPLKFHDWPISQSWMGMWGGIEVTRAVHRFSAWAMVAVCLYHLVYIAYSTIILKRSFPTKMIPSGKDFINLLQELGYLLGLRKEMPRFDRFNWKMKFDYYAIFWGMPIIGGSGFILMFPVLAAKYLPGWVIPAALVAHSDEAMLALIWIFMVHIFFSHLTPAVFPLNTCIFTGKMSKERYRREHTLEYERLMGIGEGKAEVGASQEEPKA